MESVYRNRLYDEEEEEAGQLESTSHKPNSTRRLKLCLVLLIGVLMLTMGLSIASFIRLMNQQQHIEALEISITKSNKASEETNTKLHLTERRFVGSEMKLFAVLGLINSTREKLANLSTGHENALVTLQETANFNRHVKLDLSRHNKWLSNISEEVKSIQRDVLELTSEFNETRSILLKNARLQEQANYRENATVERLGKHVEGALEKEGNMKSLFNASQRMLDSHQERLEALQSTIDNMNNQFENSKQQTATLDSELVAVKASLAAYHPAKRK